MTKLYYNNTATFVLEGAPEDIERAFDRATEDDFPYKKSNGQPFDNDDTDQHLAWNVLSNGVTDISQLDGWADFERGKITFRVTTVDVEDVE